MVVIDLVKSTRKVSDLAEETVNNNYRADHKRVTVNFKYLPLERRKGEGGSKNYMKK